MLFVDGAEVYRNKAINISEGGILLEDVKHFPTDKEISCLAILPQLPMLKNYDFEKLKTFSRDTIPPRFIRFKAKMVRKIEVRNKVKGLFGINVGLQIVDATAFDKAKISHYVDIFTSNILYLQVLIDSIDNDKINLEKVRLLSTLLGYKPDEKISLLRKKVEEDYLSLQWL